jgi:hypothetical protein
VRTLSFAASAMNASAIASSRAVASLSSPGTLIDALASTRMWNATSRSAVKPRTSSVSRRPKAFQSRCRGSSPGTYGR